MGKRIFVSLSGIIVVTSLLTGCAGVHFYDSADPCTRKDPGIKYYISKPYLLVTRTGSKDNPVKVDILSLPDLSHPFYAKYHAGWGTHQFSLKLSTGILTEYGQTADSKGPETIKALADGFSTAAAAYTGLFPPRKEAEPVDPAIGNIDLAVGSLNSVLQLPEAQKSYPANCVAIHSAVTNLTEISTHLKAAGADRGAAKKSLQQVSKDVDVLQIPNPQATHLAVQVNSGLTVARLQIDAAVAALEKVSPTKGPDDFELYEIRMDDKGTHLIRVNPGMLPAAMALPAQTP